MEKKSIDANPSKGWLMLCLLTSLQVSPLHREAQAGYLTERKLCLKRATRASLLEAPMFLRVT